MDAGAVQDLIAKIDTTKTVISDYCPAYLSNRRCEPERYRNLEGICNNLENPHWGAAMVAHSRFLPSAFADGISAPRISVLGKELPTARLVFSITKALHYYHEGLCHKLSSSGLRPCSS